MKKKILQASLLLIILSWASAVSLSYPEWTLQIDGEVNHPLNLTLDELAAMPQTTVNAALYCYGTLVTSGNWTGVQLSLLLEKAGYDNTAGSVVFYATDGYTVSILMSTALREDVIIAYEQNGQPLPETLRLVIPGTNGNLWISMINHLKVSMEQYETSQSQPEIPKNNPPSLTIPQPSPMPQPTPTPTPQTSPTPSPSPSSSPTATPISTEKSPATLKTAAVVGVILAVASASLLIYFKKHR